MPEFRETIINKIDENMVTEDNIKNLKHDEAIRKGAVLIQEGEIVAFPTETVYGLGADATNEKAVKKIFKAKGRPQDNPLIVHIASSDWLPDLIKGEISSIGKKLIMAFWPGPLTIILPKSPLIPERTTAGLDSVAIRMPSHSIARALIAKSSLPVAAPSANSSGYPSPTRAEHVYYDLQNKIPYIIDGGSCPVGVESTVVDIRTGKFKILRPGGITREEISRELDSKLFLVDKFSKGKHNSEFDKDIFKEREDKIKRDSGKNIDVNKNEKVPLSPGMKYRHYSPTTPLKLIEKFELGRIDDLLEEYKSKYKVEKIGLVITRETAEELDCLPVTECIEMGSVNKLKEIAHNLFTILRQLDRKGLDLILVEIVPEKGLGEAIMNRLYKAAGREL